MRNSLALIGVGVAAAALVAATWAFGFKVGEIIKTYNLHNPSDLAEFVKDFS